MDLARLGAVDRPRARAERSHPTRAATRPTPGRWSCSAASAAPTPFGRRACPADHNTDIVYLTRLTAHEITRYERSTPDDVRAGTPARRRRQLADAGAATLPVAALPRARPAPATPSSSGTSTCGRAGSSSSFEQDDDGVTVDRPRRRHRRASARSAARVPRRLRRRRAASCARPSVSRLDGIPRLNDMCSTYFRSPRVAELAAVGAGLDAAVRRRRRSSSPSTATTDGCCTQRVPERRGPRDVGPGAGDVRRDR